MHPVPSIEIEGTWSEVNVKKVKPRNTLRKQRMTTQHGAGRTSCWWASRPSRRASQTTSRCARSRGSWGSAPAGCGWLWTGACGTRTTGRSPTPRPPRLHMTQVVRLEPAPQSNLNALITSTVASLSNSHRALAQRIRCFRIQIRAAQYWNKAMEAGRLAWFTSPKETTVIYRVAGKIWTFTSHRS